MSERDGRPVLDPMGRPLRQRPAKKAKSKQGKKAGQGKMTKKKRSSNVGPPVDGLAAGVTRAPSEARRAVATAYKASWLPMVVVDAERPERWARFELQRILLPKRVGATGIGWERVKGGHWTTTDATALVDALDSMFASTTAMRVHLPLPATAVNHRDRLGIRARPGAVVAGTSAQGPHAGADPY